MGEVVYLFGRETPAPRRATWARTRASDAAPQAEVAARARRRHSAPPAPSAPVAAAPSGAAFFFELGCPISYIAAERIERALGELAWVPAARLESERGRDPIALANLLAFATREATALRLPLVVPENFGGERIGAWRAAAYASSAGAGSRFALAASRLAFCGGFDLGRRAVLTEAARAAGLSARECLEAATDPSWDAQLYETARGLAARGVLAAPAIRVGDRWFSGRDAVRQAGSFSASLALQRRARAVTP